MSLRVWGIKDSLGTMRIFSLENIIIIRKLEFYTYKYSKEKI